MTNAVEANAKARVLFVDDEPRILTTMKMLFRSRHQVFTADGGEQALALLKTQPVDVIVSDQRMPGMTGIELLRASREVAPNAMRILLTGYSDLSAIIGSINEGEIFRFINKPWVNDELAATVARAIDAARASAAAIESGEVPESAHVGEAPAVLVLDEDRSVAPQVQAMLGDDFRVFGAGDLDHAVALMEQHRIGVVVSETSVQGVPVVGLIGTLKQYQPELVSMILTDRADAGSAIELINQGQIYRFITKPIHASQCRIAISSALRQHHRLLQNPELHQRYDVKPAESSAPTANVANKLMDRIRGLRRFVKRWA